MIEVPTFIKGESGYNAKLNALADAVRDLQKAVSDLASGVGLTEMTVVELRALAKREGIDLGDVTKKDDIIAAIEATEA